MYAGAHRGEGDEESKIDEGHFERLLDEYVGVISKKTEMFSTYSADEIFEVLDELANAQTLNYEVAKDKYKMKMMFLIGEGKKASNVELTVKLFKVKDSNKICIDVQRNGGDVFVFF
jgi:hypothetical protein